MPTAPKLWTTRDIPAPEEMTAYLDRVRAARDALRLPSETPRVSANMDRLTFEEANDIERVLLAVDETIDRMKKSRVYSGEFQAGGF